MFHKLRFGERAERGQAAKLSFGGGRITDIYLYLQEFRPAKRDIVKLCIGNNDILKRKRHPHGMTIEEIFELYVSFIECFANRSSPQVLRLCTFVHIPPAKFPWNNREAEQLNGYIKAYAAYIDHVVLIDIYNRMQDEIDQKWEEYYESHILLPHTNRAKDHPIINNQVKTAIDC